jgi:dimethylamine monooxygenase subunit A
MGVAPDWLTPASRIPWPVSAPFRMRPNLQKLDPVAPALLWRDEMAQVYRRERERVITAHPERALVGEPHEDALAAISRLAPSPLVGAGWGEGAAGTSDHAASSHATPRLSPVLQTASAQACADRSGGGSHAIRNPASTAQLERANDVALAMQEDFVILKHDGDTLRTEYLSVCFPSRWDPREKLGLDFAAIHAPVADNQMLLAAGPNIMTMAFMKQPMLRHVWLIVPSASLAQHPEQNDYSWSETLKDQAPLLRRLFFRVERQTTWPLPMLSRAVFFIRVMMCPLVDVIKAAPGRAAELAASLRSMTPAIVAYRGMTDALPRLLSELDGLAAQPLLPRSPGEAGRW